MTRFAHQSQGRRTGVAMLQLPLSLRSAARGRAATGVAALALLLVSPAPLLAQQRDSAVRDSSSRGGIQVISPEAGRRRAEAAGTVIPGERPAGPLSFAPDSAPELSDLFTAREMERMGLAKLSAEEQAALAGWIVRSRTMGRMGMAMGPRAWAVPLNRRFPVARVEHLEQGDPRTAIRVREISGNGSLVELADGTLWEVYLPDRPKTDAWTAAEAVRLRRASVAVNGFDHEMLNGGEADRVLVRFRGRR